MSETKETEFSVWLKGQLAARGLKISEFIEISRLSKPAIHFFLQGRRLPTPDSASKIATALQLPLPEVMQFARKGVGRPPSFGGGPNKFDSSGGGTVNSKTD